MSCCFRKESVQKKLQKIDGLIENKTKSISIKKKKYELPFKRLLYFTTLIVYTLISAIIFYHFEEILNYTLQVLLVFSLFLSLFLIYKMNTWYKRKKEKNHKNDIKTLVFEQSELIENLKIETNFYETFELIEKYEKRVLKFFPNSKSVLRSLKREKVNKSTQSSDVLFKSLVLARVKQIENKLKTQHEKEVSEVHKKYLEEIKLIKNFKTSIAKKNKEIALLKALLLKFHNESKKKHNPIKQDPDKLLSPTPIDPQKLKNGGKKNIFKTIVDTLGFFPTKEDSYALICKKCGSHNGLILLDDFINRTEDVVFKCIDCQYFNVLTKNKITKELFNDENEKSAPEIDEKEEKEKKLEY